jgi:hypothetical protein
MSSRPATPLGDLTKDGKIIADSRADVAGVVTGSEQPKPPPLCFARTAIWRHGQWVGTEAAARHRNQHL